MKLRIILLAVGILGLLLFIYVQITGVGQPIDSSVDLEINTSFPVGGEQQITDVPEPAAKVSALFTDGRTSQLESFVIEHLNQDVFESSVCEDGTSRYISLVLNFQPNSAGLNTTEAGEAFLEDNYSEIAPAILSSLLGIDVPASAITVFAFNMFDPDALIHRAPTLVNRQSGELYHTWIGNTVTFSDSFDCTLHVLEEFYGSH